MLKDLTNLRRPAGTCTNSYVLKLQCFNCRASGSPGCSAQVSAAHMLPAVRLHTSGVRAQYAASQPLHRLRGVQNLSYAHIDSQLIRSRLQLMGFGLAVQLAAHPGVTGAIAASAKTAEPSTVDVDQAHRQLQEQFEGETNRPAQTAVGVEGIGRDLDWRREWYPITFTANLPEGRKATHNAVLISS